MKNDSKKSGKKYWQSLEELTSKQDSAESVPEESSSPLLDFDDGLSRRKFLTLMSASLAFGGLAGCRRPVEKIIPYVIAPEEIIPGVAQHYATSMPFGLNAYGLIVESHEGHPTKIEGNKDHPTTLGMSNHLIQASILGLYDPDRSKAVTQKGAESDWADFVAFWQSPLPKFVETGGEGLAILSESFSSPTLARLKAEYIKAFPKAHWATYEPVSDENIYEGVKAATGNYYHQTYAFEKAKTILSLDSDFIFSESNSIVNARGFTDGRRVKSENDSMNRLYVVESIFSLTGSMADHRLRLQSGQIGAFTAALALELISQGLDIPLSDNLISYQNHTFDKKWISAVAKELIQNKGQSIIIAGRRQPAEVHALVYAINEALGNIGKTVLLYEPLDSSLPNRSELADLVKNITDGKISTLIILGGNPSYNSPSDIDFSSLLKKIDHTIQISPYDDETSSLVEWHLPESHYLESWGDVRAIDGTMSVVQPLIQPLFGGHSKFEALNLIVTGRDLNGHEIVRQNWMSIIKEKDFETEWRQILHDGLLKNSQTQSVIPIEDNQLFTYLANHRLSPSIEKTQNLEIVFCASPNIFDGRYSNNGWLQELPDPITKLTWDNPILLSPKTAENLSLQNQDMTNLQYKNQSLEMPVWIVPGIADNSAVVYLGYSRKSSGRVGNDVGFDTYRLRNSSAPDFDSGLTIKKTGSTYLLASAQNHDSMEGRPIIREATLDYYRDNPNFAPEMVETPPLQSLWKEHEYKEGYQWGMAIDLNICIGCNACTTACQSENNIPIVGKEQISRNRKMHWIRIDRYFSGDPESPEMLHQPVPCQHCENAPCEEVCPVAATTHDKEGLNVMVYNRCVGTRYCSNNCPYKVRRFNFFNFTKSMPEIEKMAQNPDVTVRSRGIMEKCTYCIQRISRAKIDAKKEERVIADGEIVTACQQACPTQAIIFGNINDPASGVLALKKQNRNYGMLEEFNTRPRTSYLAKLRNPNPELEKS